MPYVATINVPGCLPMDDEPPIFETAGEAWWWLYHERCDADWRDVELPEDAEHDHRPTSLCPTCSEIEDSETADELGRFAISGEVGTVYGPTPGYTGEHDLGLAYSVTYVETDNS
jgi:hypothetical protein